MPPPCPLPHPLLSHPWDLYNESRVNYRLSIGDHRVVFLLCFKASSSAKPFLWKISFIQMEMNQNLRVYKTNFHMKGFALGFALKQAEGNSEIDYYHLLFLCDNH